MTGPAREDGAVLIIVLLIVTVLSLTAFAVAELAVDAPKDSSAQTDRERVVYALDSGIQAQAENLRLAAAGGAPSCPGQSLAIAGADSAPPNAEFTLNITVACGSTPSPSSLMLTATAEECPVGGGTSCTAAPQSIVAAVSYPTVAGQSVAEFTSWKETGGG